MAYSIQQLILLHESGNSSIYYKGDSIYGQPIIIKVLNSKYPTSQQLIRYNNEYEFTQDLNLEGVRKSLKQVRDRALAVARDNGIGIDEQYHERVFGLFDKLDPRTEGTRIGLALVKRIVEMHGGKIWLASEGSGKGSAFYFTPPLPAAIARL
ncbi:MAG: ATP-binding protein [Chloroflexota bacterium]|nr:ATP-binding protein [Anaerolineales bacterium]